ncbi:MAG: Brix domain-containing protein [Methanobacteriaceae archaeon]|nr:Brix domain-containing protein [Methanobacteriaceae archaeon]
MLITTSRKPSQRTRTFCRGLEQVLKARCINRGKMSLRDVFLKAGEMGTNQVAVVSERDGNPNGMEVYRDGELFATLKISVDFSPSKGRIVKDDLRLRCQVDELEKIISRIFGIPLEESRSDYYEKLSFKQKQKLKYREVKSDCNLLIIRTHQKKSTPVMEFFDASGKPCGPRIYLHQCKLEDENSKR